MANKNRQVEKTEQIYQLTTLVAGEFSLQEVLDKLAKAAVKITRVKACSIRLLDEETGDLEMRSTFGLSKEYRDKGRVSKNDPVIEAAFRGEAVVLDDMRVDDRVEYKQATVKEGLVSQLTVVMRFRRKPIGVLRLYSPKLKHFGRDDVSLARAVASQCAVAITNAKLYAEAIEGARIAEQMRFAGTVQRRMIPEKAPLMAGLDIAATYIPCFDVGGDLYDFLQIDENRIAVTIADVIGKGIPAAIMMSLFRGAIRAYADVHGGTESILNIVSRLNKMACRECRDGEFITLFYAVIDIENMTITYCNCGHEPTVLIKNVVRHFDKTQCKQAHHSERSQREEITALEKGGFVLGVEPQAEYDIETLHLKDGDCLLFYTDGLIDAANFNGEFWGRENLLETAQKLTAGPAEQMVKNILRYRRRFVGLARQVDDTSIIVVKVDRTAEPKFMKQVDF